MIDVRIPTLDRCLLKMDRHTQPDQARRLPLAKLHPEPPPQPPPEITAESVLR